MKKYFTLTNRRDSRINEIILLTKQIERSVNDMMLPRLSQEQQTAGFLSSRQGAGQEQEVAMTPLMKNALIHYGDTDTVKSPDGKTEVVAHRLKVDDKQTKAEEAIISNMNMLLTRFNGSIVKYDDTLDVFSYKHYDVQCHQNMKDNLRDIQPGQAEAREEMSELYQKPTYFNFTKAIAMLERDIVFQKAVLLILDLLPAVRASNDIKEINLPFMTKHTGVGATFWANDRTKDPKTGKTYGEITLSIAEKIKDKFDEWYKWNISTMYGRNQRGKGRLLIAVARVLNLLLNQLEGVEIPTYKEKCPLFVGYRDDAELKKVLISIGEYCQKNGFKCANEDYSAFDSTVGCGLLGIVGAISIMKANGSRSKQIAFMRAMFAQKTILVDGLVDKVKTILGRVFSGFIDTNRGGGLCNAIMMLYQCMRQDVNYSKLTYDFPYFMLVMGDDNLHVYKNLDRDKLTNDMKKIFGANINAAKYEYGPIFLQYRVYKRPGVDGYIMAYPWTRVVRSMLMKEAAKGLGPVGWTYAWYQQLFKLIEDEQSFSIAVNLLMPFDDNKLFYTTPVRELNRMLKEEDNEALKKARTDAQRNRITSTFDKLYDGDPSKERFAEEMRNGESSLLEMIQEKIRKVYDPHFYQKYGLRW